MSSVRAYGAVTSISAASDRVRDRSRPSARAVLLFTSLAASSVGVADPAYTLYGINIVGAGVGPLTSADQYCRHEQGPDTTTQRFVDRGPNFALDVHGSYSLSTTYCTYEYWRLVIVGYDSNGNPISQWVRQADQQASMKGLEVDCPNAPQGAPFYTNAPIYPSFCPQFFVSRSASPLKQGKLCLGDPINPASCAMFSTQVDESEQPGGGLSFKRFYSSVATGSADLSGGWRHSYDRSVTPILSSVIHEPYVADSARNSNLFADAATACTSGFAQIRTNVSTWTQATATYTNGVCWLSAGGRHIGTLRILYASALSPSGTTILAFDVVRDDGQLITFWMNDASIVAPPNVTLHLQKTSSGYTLQDENDSVDTYDSNGKLLFVTSRAGVVQTMSYDASNRLSAVTDSFGHRLILTYDGQNRLSTVNRP
jgi:YD repeat-containing protein